jgi:hypothetical protein
VEQRRTQRYKLQLPLQILQLGEQKVSQTGKTLDICSGGVCFTSGSEVEVGGKIEYVITLSGNNPTVRIRCLGKVLRSEKPSTDDFFEVAVTMERYQFVRAEEYHSFARPA